MREALSTSYVENYAREQRDAVNRKANRIVKLIKILIDPDGMQSTDELRKEGMLLISELDPKIMWVTRNVPTTRWLLTEQAFEEAAFNITAHMKPKPTRVYNVVTCIEDIELTNRILEETLRILRTKTDSR